MYHFIANVTKRGDLLNSFEQSNLVNNVLLSPTNSNRGKVQHVHMQIASVSYFYSPVYYITVLYLQFPHVQTTEAGEVQHLHVKIVCITYF